MLRTRVITAVVLLAVFLLALFRLPSYGWLAFAALVVGGGAWEWGGLLKAQAVGRGLYAVVTACASFALASLAADSPQSGAVVAIYLLAGLGWALVVPLWLSRGWHLPAGSGGWLVGWLVLIPAYLALVQLREFNPWFLLAGMALVWAADIAAYFAGRAFGRRKLAPSISPGKTWEGAVGAGLGVLCYGFAVAAVSGKLAQRPMSGLLAFAAALLLLTAISVVGDLFESLMKRQAGVKDSGSLLPGHGGILDRIDSLTSTLPWLGLAVAVREWWW